MRPRPDILWIVTTQWRGQALGYAGDPNARTPRLDAFAADSLNFRQAVSPHPFGPFARAAMLTGIPSPENGVRDYFDPLPSAARTVAHELEMRGYATGFFGKWHLGRRDPAAPLVGEAHAKTPVPPEARGGFGYWEGFESGFLLNDPWLHGTGLDAPTRFPGYQADVVCARAAEWLGAKGAGSRFCLVSLEAPHPPYDAPAPGVEARDPGGIILASNVPRGGDIERVARRELAGYYAHIEATDRAIGRLLDFVGSSRTVPTIAAFTSVHGDMHGAHGLFRKGWPHEESVRVPLLVRAEGGGRGASDSLVSLLDLPKWTLDWADGSAAGPPFRPRMPEESGKPQLISMPSVVRQPRQCDRIWRGWRTSSRKLVLNADGSPWLFFDLAGDPLEMRNLAGDPARAGEIAAISAEDR
jgi:arylsulfatase A-like enzyme